MQELLNQLTELFDTHQSLIPGSKNDKKKDRVSFIESTENMTEEDVTLSIADYESKISDIRLNKTVLEGKSFDKKSQVQPVGKARLKDNRTGRIITGYIDAAMAKRAAKDFKYLTVID